CNNCTCDLDAWVKLFQELNAVSGAKMSTAALYDALYAQALAGDADCGGVLSYNYFSGEPVTGFAEGRPLLVRTQNARFTLANFMRAQLFAAMGTLRIGMDILFEQEHVSLTKLYGHGGLFKTKMVGQRLMAAALHTPVAVMETAGEGGAWGIALLAAYLVRGQNKALETYLSACVFGGDAGTEIAPESSDMQGFDAYMQRYQAGLAVEKAAVAAVQ
ncbi:MAG: FGGY-family carbohydrate kinase, partial [Ruthenibacterium sp.]